MSKMPKGTQMITILAGQNSYELSRIQRELTNKFTTKYTDVALDRLDGEESSYDKIRESLESIPFLAPKKLVVLRAPSTNKQFLENYQQLLENLPDSTEVLITEPKPDKRTSYYKFLKKQSGFKACEELEERQIVNWLVAEAKEQGGSISTADAQYLTQRVGTVQSLLANEISKLVSYDQNVSRRTIELLCEPSPKSTIFELLEAAFQGDHKKMLKLYEEQRRLKVEPPQIIAMLAWQLHVIAVIAAAGEKSDQEIAKQSKINPFVISKSRKLAHSLGLVKTKKLVSRLVKLDEQSKTTQIDLSTALKSFLLTISF